MSPKQTGVKQIAQNRKAYHDYYIEDKLEAGIELCGTEVKSIRMGNVNLKDSFCAWKNGEMLVHGMHVSPYEKGNIFNRDPMRPRRLLLHRREINKLHAKMQQDGLTVVPLSLYLKDSLVKMEIAVARGKKLYDKRDADAKRSAKRDIDRALKEKNS
ncbi:MAG: SsrA-binding protein SmpB [Oscillospiraceae bacterium]|nr:SsrA-binding protein SmpB [Oscillospiraceae bacterium]